MAGMNYFTILSDSFKIWWKYQSIWRCGILLALSGTIFSGASSLYTELTSNPAGLRQTPAWPGLQVILLALFVAAWAIYLLGWSLAQAALISMVRQAETEQLVSIRRGWQAARERVRPLFGLSLLLGLPGLLMSLLVFFAVPQLSKPASAGPGPLSGEQLASVISLLSLCCALIPLALVAILASLTVVLAARACVLEGMGVRQSVQRGWQLLRRYPGWVLLNSLVVGTLLFLYSFLLTYFPGRALWAPVQQAFRSGSWSGGSLLQVAAYLLFYLVFLILLYGILTGFSETVLTRLFGELVKREALKTNDTMARPLEALG
jgi:hypothetical protein